MQFYRRRVHKSRAHLHRGMAQRVAYQIKLEEKLLALYLMQAVVRRYSQRVKYLALLALREWSKTSVAPPRHHISYQDDLLTTIYHTTMNARNCRRPQPIFFIV